jgi:hypothetical protein
MPSFQTRDQKEQRGEAQRQDNAGPEALTGSSQSVQDTQTPECRFSPLSRNQDPNQLERLPATHAHGCQSLATGKALVFHPLYDLALRYAIRSPAQHGHRPPAFGERLRRLDDATVVHAGVANQHDHAPSSHGIPVCDLLPIQRFLSRAFGHGLLHVDPCIPPPLDGPPFVPVSTVRTPHERF